MPFDDGNKPKGHPMLTLEIRSERERLRKLAARRGIKFASGPDGYTLTIIDGGNCRTYASLAAVADALKNPDPVVIPMSTYRACSICEGFDGGEDATDEQKTAAWQFLIDTGAVNTLQGWYGRTAADLIEQGICKPRRTEGAAQAA
jgi:hypothetical protein